MLVSNSANLFSKVWFPVFFPLFGLQAKACGGVAFSQPGGRFQPALFLWGLLFFPVVVRGFLFHGGFFFPGPSCLAAGFLLKHAFLPTPFFRPSHGLFPEQLVRCAWCFRACRFLPVFFLIAHNSPADEIPFNLVFLWRFTPGCHPITPFVWF